MRQSLKKGFSFGLTSAIITTLGLIVGLHSSTHNKMVVLGAVLIIAIGDALSDSLGMHISQESVATHTHREVWESTISTFMAKFIMALTFVVPILLLPLSTAIIVSIIWGLLIITLFSYYLAKIQKIEPYKVIFEHVLIAVVVIIITHFVGDWVRTLG